MATIRIHETKRTKAKRIASKLQVSEIMVNRVISEYLMELKNDLLQGRSVNINGLVTLTPVEIQDEDGTTRFKVRSRTSASINNTLKEIEDYKLG